MFAAGHYSPVRIPFPPVGETASEHVGIERAERSHHAAPPVEARGGESLRKFVAVALATFAGVLALSGVVNAIVDPLGSVGTGLVQPIVFSDHAERLKLIDRLSQPPQLVVLGSSRALKAEPSYLQQLTGLRGFNAAAANGKTEDGFAYANLFHDRWPDARIRYLWLLEAEAFRDRPPSPQLLQEPALARHFPASARAGSRLDDLQRLFEWNTTKASAKTVWHALRGAPQEGAVELAPDGFRAVDQHDVSERDGISFQSRLDESTATARTFVPTMQKDGLAPAQKRYFEQAVADMNRWGVEPVIVLGPVHPAYRAAMGGPAYDRLNDELTAYLASLHGRLRFTVADERDLATFGGSPNEFYDGIHMHVANMRKMLANAVREAGAALQ
jgi:hypothetical protein